MAWSMHGLIGEHPEGTPFIRGVSSPEKKRIQGVMDVFRKVSVGIYLVLLLPVFSMPRGWYPMVCPVYAGLRNASSAGYGNFEARSDRRMPQMRPDGCSHSACVCLYSKVLTQPVVEPERQAVSPLPSTAASSFDPGISPFRYQIAKPGIDQGLPSPYFAELSTIVLLI
jgi:hypothetical protein